MDRIDYILQKFDGNQILKDTGRELLTDLKQESFSNGVKFCMEKQASSNRKSKAKFSQRQKQFVNKIIDFINVADKRHS